MHLPSPLRKSPRKSVFSPSASPSRNGNDTLQPPTAPSALRTTFKDSLRKIPSTIFLRSDKERERRHHHHHDNDMTSHGRLAPPAPTRTPAPTGTATVTLSHAPGTQTQTHTQKARTKTRKALGGLFGWGNVPTPSPPTPPAKAPVVISAPAPLPRRPVKLEKKPSTAVLRRLDNKTSMATIRSPPATLHAPLRDVSRTSMSDDPFGAPDQGAEVVEHIVRPSYQTPSIKSEATARERRRDSMCSSKALSTKTVFSDDESVREVAMRARMSSPRRVTMASVIEEKKRLSAQSAQSTVSTSTASVSSADTIELLLPPRTGCLGRSLNLPSIIHEAPSFTAPPQTPLPAPNANLLASPIPRQRSQVLSTPAPPPRPAVVPLPTPIEPRLKKDKTKSRVWGFLGKKAKVKETVPEISSPRPLELGYKVQPILERPLPAPPVIVPVLHISHPSVDAECAPARKAMNTTRPVFGATVTSNTDTSSSSSSQSSGIPSQAARALGNKPLPKRKSLNGLFGLAIQRSEDHTSRSMTSITDWEPPAIRPLSEEMDEICFGTASKLSPIKKANDGLRRVASATDKLVSLVSNFSFSPGASPTKGVVNMSSFSSLKGTPTPLRRSQSAMLLTSPIKVENVETSPARIRQMPGVGMDVEMPGSPPRSSMVKKGMRNPFAPPSPEKPAPNRPRQLGQGPNAGLAGCVDDEMIGGMPADLYAMLQANEVDEDDMPTGIPPPPKYRSSRRCAPRAAPAISLPPVPDLPPQLRITPDSPDQRASFDFEAEFDQLDTGKRDSFMAALHRVESRDMLVTPALPPLPHTLYTIEQSPDSVRTLSPGVGGLAAPVQVESSRKVSPARQRKAPFQGNVAFQQHVSRGREHTQTYDEFQEETHAELAPTAQPSRATSRATSRSRSRTHSRAMSGVSIATMSSIGDVIDPSESPREYTNYFEVNFAEHLSRQQSVDSVAEILAISQAMAHGRVESGADPRAPTRRGHHRRNSSIVSIDSLGGVPIVHHAGPPNSLFNKHRSGYVSRHRRNGSTDSARGRSDWASHRRNTSTDSTASDVSLARIGRPGLGERMFQLDGGVNLASIEGSPQHIRGESWDQSDNGGNDVTPRRQHAAEIGVGAAPDQSYDSILDGLDTSFGSQDKPDPDFSLEYELREKASWDSENDKRASTSTVGSVFGFNSDAETGVLQRGFFIKARPVSAVSDSEQSEDAFIDANKYALKAECIEARGEALDISVNGRTVRPRPARRTRPARLVFEDPPMDTPGLSSPSTSDSSSRMSLDTRFSDGQSFFGHQRQKSSYHVKAEPTIVEEPSSSTLYAPKLATQLSRENLRKQAKGALVDDEQTGNVTMWLQFQREAADVCKRAKSFYRDSDESRAAVAEFKEAFSPNMARAFIANSNATYRSLEQAQRRERSSVESRAQLSPYGLPLPRASVPCKPRGSLTTKFERSNSAQSRHSLGPSEEATSTPTSGIFDGFMPELAHLPAQRRSTPPSSLAFAAVDAGGDAFGVARYATANATVPGKMQLKKGSSPPSFAPGPMCAPAQLRVDKQVLEPVEEMKRIEVALQRPVRPILARAHATSPVPTSPLARSEVLDEAASPRARVNSGERRKALGWGRRRDSDGPEQAGAVLASVKPATAAVKIAPAPLPLPLATLSTAQRERERGSKPASKVAAAPVFKMTAPVTGAQDLALLPRKTGKLRVLVDGDKENDAVLAGPQRTVRATPKVKSRRVVGAGGRVAGAPLRPLMRA